MSFEKLPAIQGSVSCLTCGCGAHETLEMGRVLAVGFGDVVATRDGITIYSESEAERNGAEWEDYWNTQKVEDVAKTDPNHDWRINFMAPLYGAEYQRQGDGHWVLVRKDQGFA